MSLGGGWLLTLPLRLERSESPILSGLLRIRHAESPRYLLWRRAATLGGATPICLAITCAFLRIK